MLAAYLVWHVRKAWAPLTLIEENQPDPVATAKRSTAAQLKAFTGTTTAGAPAYSFTGLLDHLATLTTSQRRAFEFIGCPIPIGLK